MRDSTVVGIDISKTHLDTHGSRRQGRAIHQ